MNDLGAFISSILPALEEALGAFLGVKVYFEMSRTDEDNMILATG